MSEARRASGATAPTFRSQLVLEIAAGLVGAQQQPLRQAKVMLRAQGMTDWPIVLHASSTNAGIDEVVCGESTLGIVNPSAALTLAHRGQGAYAIPQPVSVLTVMPSHDQFVFAVKCASGLTYLEEVGERRVPLRIGVRGQPDHYLHLMLEHALQAAGFSSAELTAWGGAIVAEESSPPRPGGIRFAALARGELDAIFDEGAAGWLGNALASEMTALSLRPATLRALEELGYRTAVLEQRLYPPLGRDVATLDFSGWPVFVRTDCSAALVTQMCTALDERRANIQWDGDGPLPVERMCRDGLDTPLDVPLHPAAEAYWRSRGYLR